MNAEWACTRRFILSLLVIAIVGLGTSHLHAAVPIGFAALIGYGAAVGFRALVGRKREPTHDPLLGMLATVLVALLCGYQIERFDSDRATFQEPFPPEITWLLAGWLGALHGLWSTRQPREQDGPRFLPKSPPRSHSRFSAALASFASLASLYRGHLYLLFAVASTSAVAACISPGQLFLPWRPRWVPHALLATTFGLIAVTVGMARLPAPPRSGGRARVVAAVGHTVTCLTTGFQVAVVFVSVLAAVVQWVDRLVQVGAGTPMFLSGSETITPSPMGGIPWVAGSGWLIVLITTGVGVGLDYYSRRIGSRRNSYVRAQAAVFVLTWVAIAVVAPMWAGASRQLLGSSSVALAGQSGMSYTTLAWLGLSMCSFSLIATTICLFLLWDSAELEAASDEPDQLPLGSSSDNAVSSARLLSVSLLILGYFGVQFALVEIPELERLVRVRVEIARQHFASQDRSALFCAELHSTFDDLAVTSSPTGVCDRKRKVLKLAVRHRYDDGKKWETILFLTDARGDPRVGGSQWVRTGETGARQRPFAMSGTCETSGETLLTCLRRLEDNVSGFLSVPSVSVKVPRRLVVWFIAFAVLFLLVTLRSRLRLIARDPEGGIESPWLLLDAESRTERAVSLLWVAAVTVTPWVVSSALIAMISLRVVALGEPVAALPFEYARFGLAVTMMLFSGRAAFFLGVEVLELQANRRDRRLNRPAGT